MKEYVKPEITVKSLEQKEIIAAGEEVVISASSWWDFNED